MLLILTVNIEKSILSTHCPSCYYFDCLTSYSTLRFIQYWHIRQSGSSDKICPVPQNVLSLPCILLRFIRSRYIWQSAISDKFFSGPSQVFSIIIRYSQYPTYFCRSLAMLDKPECTVYTDLRRHVYLAASDLPHGSFIWN